MMGYQVEYLLELTPSRARDWLTQFDGWFELGDQEDVLYWGEFYLWDGLYLHVELGFAACHLKIPQILHSWLVHEYHPAISQIRRFDALVESSLHEVLGVRIDELYFHEWEAAIGHPWHTLENPVESLQNWVISFRQDTQYFRFFPTEQA